MLESLQLFFKLFRNLTIAPAPTLIKIPKKPTQTRAYPLTIILSKSTHSKNKIPSG